MSTGLIYHQDCLAHVMGTCPESPERLQAIIEHLRQDGVMDRLQQVTARPATEAEVLHYHTRELLSLIRSLAEDGGGELDSDTYVSAGSFRATLLAVGATLQAVEMVVHGDLKRTFALVRPPGHHATACRAMGFCLFNNAAVAARVALTRGWVKRLAIIDIDVHHGNGTASAFWTDPRVLYISTHQSPLYPATGNWRDTGSGEGRGTTLNIPLPPFTGEQGFIHVFDELVGPALRRYRPQLLLVSAGYDAHWADPLAGMLLTVGSYAAITARLVAWADELCDGRLAFCLEGGYHLEALANSVSATLGVLTGVAVADSLGTAQMHEVDIGDLPERIARRHSLLG
ncbi:MAG: histone deacetylase [Chloroflexi bacterium]|nr:histone deacetylase [Chloroflexota bacterium]